MNCNSKRILTAIMSVAMIICMLFAFGTTTASADGEQAPTTTNYTFTMNEGVSTKLLYGERAVDGVNNAIRFSSSIEKSAIDNNVGSFDVKVKTIITKTESLKALDGKSFTKANIDNYNEGVEESKKIKYQEVVFSEGRNLTQNNKDTSYVFNACLYNVKDENYAQSLSAISYLEINGVATQYTNATSGSLWNTANTHRLSLDQDEDSVADDGGLQDELDFVSTLCKTYDVTVNDEHTITLKHGEYLTSATDAIMAAVNVDGMTYFDGTMSGADITKPVTSNLAITANVGSLEYIPVDASGKDVASAESAVGYKVTKGNLASVATGTVIKIPETYNGDYGELPVLKIGKFNNLTDLKKFIATEQTTLIGTEAFWRCSNLEFVSIPGVTALTEGNEFHRCTSLKTLVVGAGFKQKAAQSFNNGNNTQEGAIIDVYTLGAVDSVTLITGKDQNLYKNGLLTGNIYSYDERGICNTWKYNDAGDGVILNTYEEHNYTSDKCIHCGFINTKGINYEWDDTAKVYYVTANAAYDVDEFGTVLNVLSEYNDLIHGSAAVVGVKKEAFNSRTSTSYAGVTHIILPESVTVIETEAFRHAVTLKYVSMLGVSKLSGNNHFSNATALEQVVIKKSLTYPNQSFIVTSSYSTGYTAKVDIFAMEEGGTVTCLTADSMRTGKTYTFDEKLTCGMTWKYDTDGLTIRKAASEHNFVNDKCENCGIYDTKGVNYIYVEGEGYYVTANILYDASVNGPIINVPSKYNDLIHGEADVVGVKANAFAGSVGGSTPSYVGVTHIILPESVTILEAGAFYKSGATYISMLGVIEIKATNSSNNQFRLCNNLKTLVVNENLKVDGQVLSTSGSAVTNLYVKGSDTSKITVTGNNNLLTGNKYSYSDTQPEESLLATTWRYDENGYAILWSEYLANQA